MTLFASFIGDYTFIFLIAIVSLVFAIALHSAAIFLGQFFLLGAILLVNLSATSVLYIPITILQIALSLFLLYKIKKAIDRNYLLVMEKTHQKEPDLINNNYGNQSSFL